MLTRQFRIILVTLAIFISTGSAQAAFAANLGIDDSVENQITFTPDGNFEGGTVGGGLQLGESGIFSGTWIVNTQGSPNPGTGIIYFTDSCTGMVSDIVTASWEEVTVGIATITITVQSSPDGADLGPVPALFEPFAIPEPTTPLELVGLFRDPATTASVSLPSNLTLQFASDDEICPIGGEIISIDHMALFLAGMQSNAVWMIPTLFGLAGAGIFFGRLRNREN